MNEHIQIEFNARSATRLKALVDTKQNMDGNRTVIKTLMHFQRWIYDAITNNADRKQEIGINISCFESEKTRLRLLRYIRRMDYEVRQEGSVVYISYAAAYAAEKQLYGWVTDGEK
ncbi:MAG: hypothetical protein ABW007_19150 [Chitinophagaceae bacterium]